jgi:chemotaxis protein histidine kinase CheA
VASQLALPAGESGAPVVTLVLTDVRGELVALRVDRVVGQQQIYVKPVPELLAPLRALSGLTILGDGRPIFVVDPNQVA